MDICVVSFHGSSYKTVLNEIVYKVDNLAG